MSKIVRPIVSRPIDDQIAKIEAEVTAKVAAKSTESVYIAGWGEFSKTESGGWNGPGGFYGPSTPMGQQCEELLQKNKELLISFVEARQRHHDFYVFLHRDKKGILTQVDRLNYELAMKREEAGEADPLPEDAINYFKTKVQKEKSKEAKH